MKPKKAPSARICVWRKQTISSEPWENKSNLWLSYVCTAHNVQLCGTFQSSVEDQKIQSYNVARRKEIF